MNDTPARLAHTLEDQLVAEFDDKGYCVIPAVLCAAELASMRGAILQEQLDHPLHYRLLGQSRDGGPVGEHGRWQSGKTMHVTTVFDPLLAHPKVMPLLRRLIGPELCLTHGAYAGVRDPPADAAPRFGERWPLGTDASAPWRTEEGILWQLWHREQGGLFAPHHPRCITSVQCRYQFDDTDGTTTCISAVPESVAEKKKLGWRPLRKTDGTPHPKLAQLTERFVHTMWRNRAADALHLLRPGVDIAARAGDVILMNNTNIHAGTVRAGSHAPRMDFRVDYGQKGLTQTPPSERVGDMSAEESNDAATSWNYLKIPTRIAAAHPELIDTLPAPALHAESGRARVTAPGGGGGVNSPAVRGVQRPGTCTPSPSSTAAAATAPRTRIAAVVTVYRQGSHADVLLGKFLPGRGIPLDDGFHELRVELVGLYIDQIGSQGPDIGVALAEAHGVPVYPSIRQTLCAGGEQLAVDGVLMIGEHGDYPWNEKHQQLFPRKYVSAAWFVCPTSHMYLTLLLPAVHGADMWRVQRVGQGRADLQRQAPQPQLGRRQMDGRARAHARRAVHGRLVDGDRLAAPLPRAPARLQDR
eukprot:SAG11_NODE_220_length_12154_cov_92.233347_10_plen_584_part_00